MTPKFVNAALNVHVDSLFTYSVPPYFEDNELIGKRVLVPFGNRKLTALIIGTTNQHPENIKTKTVLEVLDYAPIISVELIEFCKWISSYYICPIGEVFFSALPKGIHVEEKIAYSLNPEADLTSIKMTSSQKEAVNILRGKPLTYKQISARIKNKNLRSVLSSLISKKILTWLSNWPKSKKQRANRKANFNSS